ncbi:MAG: hypothetical protein JWN79_792, partial [Gemmatimonadetes bacterium]|nr:hypothetical protein [Gemmatimonadota bacterium]
MKRIALATAIILTPSLAHAQAAVQAQSHTRVDASAQASGTRGNRQAAADASAQSSTEARVDASAERHAAADASNAASRMESRAESRLSAEASARIEANVRTARARKLPEQPIRDRAAEGQAKGASDAQIVAASARALADLQTSHDAMVRAGREEPSGEEVARGASLVARGFTSTQLEAVARRAPADRSLTVAFETLTSLQANGASTAKAAARVEQLLAARASDDQLRQVVMQANAGASASGALGAGHGAGALNGNAAAGVAGS